MAFVELVDRPIVDAEALDADYEAAQEVETEAVEAAEETTAQAETVREVEAEATTEASPKKKRSNLAWALVFIQHHEHYGPRPVGCASASVRCDGQSNHRSSDPEFLALMEDIKELLRYCFKTKNTLTLPLSAPGSAAMEHL